MKKYNLTKFTACVITAGLIVSSFGVPASAAGFVRDGVNGGSVAVPQTEAAAEDTSPAAAAGDTADTASADSPAVRAAAADTSAASDAADTAVTAAAGTEAAASSESSGPSLSSTLGTIARSGITTVTADEADMYVASVSAQAVFSSLCDDLAIANVDDYVNVRTDADVESDIVGKVYTGCGATILDTVTDSEENTWYYIESGNVTGYIRSEYFLTGQEATDFAVENGKVYMVSTETGLRVHDEASLQSDVLATMYVQQSASVNSVEGDFLEVTTVSYEGVEVTGYVYTGYTETFIEVDNAITLEEEQAIIAEQERIAAEEAARAAEAQAAADAAAAAADRAEAEEAAAAEERQTSTSSAPAADTSNLSGARSTIVNYAMNHVGCSYSWAAQGPNAFDCSGLVCAAYAAAGIGVPHQSGRLHNSGTIISVSEAQPGDVLWMPGHVGIYVGGGMAVDARNYSSGVVYGPLSSNGWSCAVRII